MDKRTATRIEPGLYEWRTPSGDIATINREIIEALAAIDRVMPGCKAKWWRVPGGEWRQVGVVRS